MPGRFANELNGVSGIAGVGGTAIGIAGWTALAGTAGTILMSSGLAISVFAFGYAIVKAIPPTFKRSEDLIGNPISMEVLGEIDPPVFTLAIVGPSRAGKTTLKNRLSFRPRTDQRTQSITAQIVPIANVPKGYIAILDGGGEQFVQQFKICEKADCICIVLDHNETSEEQNVDNDRIRQQKEFLKQIRYHLTSAGCRPKKWIHLLLNKRDLWEKSPDTSLMIDFVESELEDWKNGRYSNETELFFHSNESGDDIARLMAILGKTVIS